jgi:hypothetical protein
MAAKVAPAKTRAPTEVPHPAQSTMQRGLPNPTPPCRAITLCLKRATGMVRKVRGTVGDRCQAGTGSRAAFSAHADGIRVRLRGGA